MINCDPVANDTMFLADLPEPRLGSVIIRKCASSDRERYLRWDSCRRFVFGHELGWRLARPAPDAPYSDRFDANATFFSAEEGPALIGIIRSLRTEVGFPHRELFEQHLLATGLHQYLAAVGTLNALAVVPSRRRQRYVTETDGHADTASALLLRASIQDLAESGVSVVFATVLSVVSARTFMRAGFRLLDLPVLSRDDNRFVLANVGLTVAGLHADDPPNAQCRSLLAPVGAYFDRCQKAVLAHGTLEDLFAMAAPLRS